MHMDVHKATRAGMMQSALWAVGISLVIIGIAAGVGRATMNLTSALSKKPDVAIYLLLPEEEITRVEVLRELEDERHYLASTKTGPKVVILKRGEEEWYVSHIEALRE